MKLVFYNNSLNHHQVYLADEFYRMLGDNYAYITTVSHNTVNLKGGIDYKKRPYCIMAGDSEEGKKKALNLVRSAEVCVFGAESLEYAIERAKVNPSALSFEVSERWLKKGWLNIFSPRLIRWWIAYQRYFRNSNFYKLNASAFAAADHVKLHTYKNRQYKWGYFTDVSCTPELSDIKRKSDAFKLMWCARFIDWKHPELAIECARELKKLGYSFVLNMYGDGILRKTIEKKVEEYFLNDCVKIHGNVSNKQVREAMINSDIFLFTSDRKEGWGAVANESLSCGCSLIGSDAIGSVPYLVKNGFNGFIYKCGDVNDLREKVEYLFNHQSELSIMQRNAKKNMLEVWSPKHAAENLLRLIEDLENNRNCTIKVGPASKG